MERKEGMEADLTTFTKRCPTWHGNSEYNQQKVGEQGTRAACLYQESIPHHENGILSSVTFCSSQADHANSVFRWIQFVPSEKKVFLPPIFYVNVKWELLCRFWQVTDVLSAAPVLEKLVQTILGVIHKQTLRCGCVDETATIQSLIGIQERLYMVMPKSNHL